MFNKILYSSLIFQIIVLVLLLTGIDLNRNGQNGIAFLYAALMTQIIVLALVVYLAIKKQQVKINKKQ